VSGAVIDRRAARAKGGERSKLAGLDWFDWLCLIGTAAVAFAVTLPLLLTGNRASGADGVYAVDQFQYLAWARLFSENWLIGNPFDMAPDTRVFLHPGFLISGLVHRVTGLSLIASYSYLWKCVSVLVVFFAARLYARRLLEPVWPQRVGLVLAIFVVSPWSALMKWAGIGAPKNWVNLDFVTGEMSAITHLQGYPMTAIATFGMVFVLLGIERARSTRRLGQLGIVSLGTLVVAWLQPWQGAELILIICLVEAWRLVTQRISPWPALAMPIAAATLPLVWFWHLSRSDPAWQLVKKANAEINNPLWSFPLWAVALALLPLVLAALLAYRARGNDWQGIAVRVWPLAVLLVYLAPLGTFHFHAIQGLCIPLAMLAVQGATSYRPSWLPAAGPFFVAPLIALLVVPGLIYRADGIRSSIDRNDQVWWLKDGDSKALDFLQADRAAGGVLSDSRFGALIPAFTGREVYAGNFSWTPNYASRSFLADGFFRGESLGGKLTPAQAQMFLAATGVRFVVQPCDNRGLTRAEVEQLIGPMLMRTLQFGCANVYVIGAGAKR
jgi:hypothetical protein